MGFIFLSMTYNCEGKAYTYCKLHLIIPQLRKITFCDITYNYMVQPYYQLDNYFKLNVCFYKNDMLQTLYKRIMQNYHKTP